MAMDVARLADTRLAELDVANSLGATKLAGTLDAIRQSANSFTGYDDDLGIFLKLLTTHGGG